MDTKTCRDCGTAKPLAEFYGHPKMRDGLQSKCKCCVRAAVKNNREKNAEYYRAYDMHRYRANNDRRAAALASFAAAAANHPERTYAAKTVSNAVRDGRLIKLPCWVCGGNAEAHHPDYSAPLDVVWLCKSHHRQTHAMTKHEA